MALSVFRWGRRHATIQVTLDLLDGEPQRESMIAAISGSAGASASPMMESLSDEDLLVLMTAADSLTRWAVAETHRRTRADDDARKAAGPVVEEQLPAELREDYRPSSAAEPAPPQALLSLSGRLPPWIVPSRRVFSPASVVALLEAMPGQPRDIATAIIERWSNGGVARNEREAAIFAACAFLAHSHDNLAASGETEPVAEGEER